MRCQGCGDHGDLRHRRPHPLHGAPHAARLMVQEGQDDAGRGEQVELSGTDQRGEHGLIKENNECRLNQGQMSLEYLLALLGPFQSNSPDTLQGPVSAVEGDDTSTPSPGAVGAVVVGEVRAQTNFKFTPCILFKSIFQFIASLPGEYGDPEAVGVGRGERRRRGKRCAAPRGQPAEQVAEDRHGAEEEHLRQEDHTQLKEGNGK